MCDGISFHNSCRLGVFLPIYMTDGICYGFYDKLVLMRYRRTLVTEFLGSLEICYGLTSYKRDSND